MEDNGKPQDLSIPETLEIVELDERLDMAFDPIGTILVAVPVETNKN
jgi:hypothetical protein